MDGFPLNPGELLGQLLWLFSFLWAWKQPCSSPSSSSHGLGHMPPPGAFFVVWVGCVGCCVVVATNTTHPNHQKRPLEGVCGFWCWGWLIKSLRPAANVTVSLLCFAVISISVGISMYDRDHQVLYYQQYVSHFRNCSGCHAEYSVRTGTFFAQFNQVST